MSNASRSPPPLCTAGLKLVLLFPPSVVCLGHKDGGALAMKVYGHLKDQHSVEMAQKVSFSNSRLDKQEYCSAAT